LLSNVQALFIAGHETTTNLIAATTIALLNDPDQLAAARCRPELDANLVEEGLRFTTPVQFNRRISKQPIVVDDVEIPAGSVVQLCAAAANRDPRKWGADADRFVLDRKGANEHVSFGGGPHFCIGAALARLEASQAIPRLIRRFPRLATLESLSYEPRLALRSVRHIVIEV
jgi:cytochrome P450